MAYKLGLTGREAALRVCFATSLVSLHPIPEALPAAPPTLGRGGRPV
jgi:hypothetical protein